MKSCSVERRASSVERRTSPPHHMKQKACDQQSTLHALRSPRSTSAFTMIEIAISLAIIGFALAAIIGILPTGMNAQKENRQETIINQDFSVWMGAFKNGERGLDDLTNYVIGITNWVTRFSPRGTPAGSYQNNYWYNGAVLAGTPDPGFGITNGYRIIGILSVPKIIPLGQQGYLSNHVVVYVRSMSGPASEKSPQQNDIVRDLGLKYRMVADVTGYGTNFFDPSWTNYLQSGISTNLAVQRFNYYTMVKNLETNMHEIRLTFLWPLHPNGQAGPSRQVFRTTVGGAMTWTNEPGFPTTPGETLFFFQPRTYAKAP